MCSLIAAAETNMDFTLCSNSW